MENVTKARHNIFKDIIDTIKTVFISSDETVNNIDDIMDWDDCLDKVNSDSFNESDKETIKCILDAEKKLQEVKNNSDSMRKNVKSVNNAMKSKKQKVNVIEKDLDEKTK